MSLRLILTRHAKSDWTEDLPDAARPLNARGHRAAGAIGSWLAARGCNPASLYLSTATRVAETWDGMACHLSPARIRRSDTLYLATPEAILDELQGCETDSAMVIAHNPGMAALAQYLTASTPDRVEFHRFPTGATVVLDIPGDDWAYLGPACGRIEHFVVPRDLD